MNNNQDNQRLILFICYVSDSLTVRSQASTYSPKRSKSIKLTFENCPDYYSGIKKNCVYLGFNLKVTNNFCRKQPHTTFRQEKQSQMDGTYCLIANWTEHLKRIGMGDLPSGIQKNQLDRKGAKASTILSIHETKL